MLKTAAVQKQISELLDIQAAGAENTTHCGNFLGCLKLNCKCVLGQTWREIAVVLFCLPSDMDFIFLKPFLLKCVGFLWKSWTLILLVFKGFPGCFCSFWTPIRVEVSCLSFYWCHLELLWGTSMQTINGFGPMNSVTNTEISQMFPDSIFSQSLFMDACWLWKDEVWRYYGSKITKCISVSIRWKN